ncbi:MULTISPECIES: acyl-CoA dehydrogenase [Thalassospira]|uniref:acyl-CoA dehydrogenase n=1 Tax=Thalassospira TaxID=168934 RepID=UPI0008DE2A4D|nr:MULTISPECIES: acyl-CoA dehydrogenase [Thalassospira]MAB33087.1 acyl-CoA dehydrogenase [Thalassospira sp.]MDM7976365.1 acyl-CoA dehydrogenase [Thalassospira xiamenensis]OHY97656.1 acyl-CoA dehydrogenase [Thalassospira sp. MIT1004]HBS22967.1 acyl-CoA dehydrogenase [Thalassospira sp.]|tara:strand:- start:202 stop:1977 length:1776 start_codon:yes stop_codon:yes gene_type:complete
MSDYTPPLHDLRFLIHNVIGLQTVSDIPAFAETSPDLVDAILEEAGKLASGVLAPLNRIGDQEGSVLQTDGHVRTPTGWKDAYDKFCEGGWQGISAPQTEGGMGLPLLLGAAVGELWHSANMAFALCPMLTAGAIELLTAHGSDEQRAIYLSRMISGEWTGTMNLTEPQAGSDLSKVRSTAEPEDDGSYRITGQKIFITYGDHEMTSNIVHLVLARTPDAPDGVKGISLFIVPKFVVNADGTPGERNDVKCVSLEHKLGIHGSPTAVLSFGDNGGAKGYLVGQKGHGLACMFTMMNNARLAVGQQGVAISERAYQQAVSYARDRKQGKSPTTGQDESIIHHGDVQRMLIRMRSTAEAARALSLYAAAQLDIAHHHEDENERTKAQTRANLLIPMVKGWSTDLGVENASLGIQVHGGMGFIEETGAAQHLRDARIAPIYEGTNGIQALDLIGRKLLRDNGAAMRSLITEMRMSVSKPHLDDNLSKAARMFGHAIDQLEQTTEDILSRCKNSSGLAQAIASPYLRQTSICVAGWLMFRSLEKLTDSDIEEGFAKAKGLSCNFFLAQIVPESDFMAQQIANTRHELLHETAPLF